MTRQERIAALEAQLANSRKRRSELGQSLGLDSGGNAGAVALEIYENGTSCSLPPSVCAHPPMFFLTFFPLCFPLHVCSLFLAYLRQEASNARIRLQSLKLPDIARTDQYGGLYAKPYTSTSSKI